MDFRLVVNVLARWWWLIILPVVVVGAWSAVTYREPANGYSMSLTFTASQPNPADESFDPTYYRYLSSEYIAAGLKDWAVSSSFAQAVNAELAARGSTATVGGVVADYTRSLCTLYLSAGDPTQLQTIAEAATHVMQTQAANALPQLNGQPLTITVLNATSPAAVPPSLRARFDPVIRIGLALIVGLALAVLAHFIDPVVRDPDDVRGLTVMAVIPKRK